MGFFEDQSLELAANSSEFARAKAKARRKKPSAVQKIISVNWYKIHKSKEHPQQQRNHRLSNAKIMKANALLKLLEDYNPTFEEISCKQKMIQFAKKHEDCFERTLSCGHFTASAWLLNKESSKALLMHHAKLDLWCQPGGHCDGDPDILRVAIKEAQEESGILGISPVNKQIFDIDIHLVPTFKGIPAHLHYDVRFLLQVTSDEDVISNKESKELRWVSKTKEELPTSELSVLRMFNKWQQRS